MEGGIEGHLSCFHSQQFSKYDYGASRTYLRRSSIRKTQERFRAVGGSKTSKSTIGQSNKRSTEDGRRCAQNKGDERKDSGTGKECQRHFLELIRTLENVKIQRPLEKCGHGVDSWIYSVELTFFPSLIQSHGMFGRSDYVFSTQGRAHTFRVAVSAVKKSLGTFPCSVILSKFIGVFVVPRRTVRKARFVQVRCFRTTMKHASAFLMRGLQCQPSRDKGPYGCITTGYHVMTSLVSAIRLCVGVDPCSETRYKYLDINPSIMLPLNCKRQSDVACWSLAGPSRDKYIDDYS